MSPDPARWPDWLYVTAVLALGPGVVAATIVRQVLRDRARRRRGEEHEGIGLESLRAAQEEREHDLREGGAPP